MNPLEVLTLVLQGVIPLTLIAAVAFARPRGRASWLLGIGVAAAYLVAIALAGLWLVLPRSVVVGYAALLAAAAVVSSRRLRPPRAHPLGWAARSGVLIALGALCVFSLSARGPFPEPPLDIAFPLAGGTYLVAAAGSQLLGNPHLKTLEPERFRPYRGQSYAVDLVRLGGWGSRIASPFPDGPEGFAIHGDPITAPCSGNVVRAEDGAPDRLAAGAVPASLEGNHVILDCSGTWVVLAHMLEGSVAVERGQLVTVGDPLGRVGNSGSSDEPHLHIHAQTPGTKDAPLSGAPVPITFDGRHLVRNDRVDAVPAAHARSGMDASPR